MIANKRKPAAKPDAATDDSNKRNRSDKFPPFVKHFRTSNAADAAPYKLGDSKTWQGDTWYFCDCPTHRDRHKWHTHSHDTCRTRIRWLENKGKQPAAANVVDVTPPVPPASVPPSDASASALSSSAMSVSNHPAKPDLSALLASALSMANDSMTKDFIADALNSIN